MSVSMDNSILIPKYIQSILEENEAVMSILNNDANKIFTLNRNDELTFPFIAHQRLNITPTYTKDFHWTNLVTYSVKCVSNDYSEVLALANATRHALETYRWKCEDIYIHPIQLASVSEYLIDDAIVEELQFELIVQ